MGIIKCPKCNNEALDKLKDIVRYLSRNLEITSEPVDHFVGLQITRNQVLKVINLSQESYILKIFRKFQMDECNSRAVPADPFSHFVKKSYSTTLKKKAIT